MDITAETRAMQENDFVTISEVADWRLSDEAFLRAFQLPAKTGRGPLADANPFPRETRVSFDEKSHKYTIDGEVCPRSVTGLLRAYINVFDAPRFLAIMRESPGWEQRRLQLEARGVNPNSDTDIEAHWKFEGEVARTRGTLLHFHAEQAANFRRVELPHSPEFSQVLQLLCEFANRGWTIYRAELNIFHCGLRCAGQPDLLLKDTQGRLVIVDWKRIPKISFENCHSALNYPFQHLANSSYWTYALQLNLYRSYHSRACLDFMVGSAPIGL